MTPLARSNSENSFHVKFSLWAIEPRAHMPSNHEDSGRHQPEVKGQLHGRATHVTEVTLVQPELRMCTNPNILCHFYRKNPKKNASIPIMYGFTS